MSYSCVHPVTASSMKNRIDKRMRIPLGPPTATAPEY
jgi:hypothetical protein